MKSTKYRSSSQLEQSSASTKAIQQYLDSLLQEATENSDANKAMDQTVLPVVKPKPEPEPPSEAIPEPQLETMPEPQPEPSSPVELPEKTTPPKHSVMRPHWSEKPFDCLLFDVAGLKLAVPLVQLGTILKMESRPTEVFRQADWMLGILTLKEQQLRVVDTARWVMPEKYDPKVKQGYEYVLTVNESDWGLAAHSIEHSVLMQPDQVKWRSQRTTRPWLAGTIIDHMCALMDMSAMSDELFWSNRS